FGVLLERGIVDQDVELAQLVDGALRRLFAELLVGDVALDHDAASAFVFDVALRLFGVAVGVEVDDGHVRALAGEEHGHGAADAGVAAGDERDHVLELAAAAIRGVVEHRARLDLRLDARLGVMLFGQWIGGIAPRAGLHAAPLFLFAAFLRLGLVDFALNLALLLDDSNGLTAGAPLLLRSHGG